MKDQEDEEFRENEAEQNRTNREAENDEDSSDRYFRRNTFDISQNMLINGNMTSINLYISQTMFQAIHYLIPSQEISAPIQGSTTQVSLKVDLHQKILMFKLLMVMEGERLGQAMNHLILL